MIQPIVLYGDEILSRPSINVGPKDKGMLGNLINDLFETMHKARGVGLSAIQIGIPLRVFVIEAHSTELDVNLREAFVNPSILYYSDEKKSDLEGCLSLPGIGGPVLRSKEIEIQWTDQYGNSKKEKFSGYGARIIQHEYDHLSGKLYTDHLDTMWSTLLEPSLELLRRREVKEVPYLIK